MKNVILFGLALLLLIAPVEARVWRTTTSDSLCVQGDGAFRVNGEGTVFLDASGSFRVDKSMKDFVEIEEGYFKIVKTRKYVYYNGDGRVRIDDFDGTLQMYGGGSGYLRLEGVGWAELRGRKLILETGC